MADKKNRPTPVSSPAGIASYPWLNKPDNSVWQNGVKIGEDPAKGKYKVSLVLSKDDPAAQKFIERIKAEYAKAVASELAKLKKQADEKGKPVEKVFDKFFDKDGKFKEANYPFRDHKEDDTKWSVSFSMNAQFKKKDSGEVVKLSPHLYTADVKPWPKGRIIGGGSRIIVSFVFNPYNMAGNGAGVSLQLQGVQVLKLEAFGEKSAAELGFSAQEGESYGDEEGSGFSDQSGGDDDAGGGSSDDGAAAGGEREF